MREGFAGLILSSVARATIGKQTPYFCSNSCRVRSVWSVYSYPAPTNLFYMCFETLPWGWSPWGHLMCSLRRVLQSNSRIAHEFLWIGWMDPAFDMTDMNYNELRSESNKWENRDLSVKRDNLTNLQKVAEFRILHGERLEWVLRLPASIPTQAESSLYWICFGSLGRCRNVSQMSAEVSRFWKARRGKKKNDKNLKLWRPFKSF
jgi:hypothetical protein